MGVVFFSFAVSPLVPFQELGVGMGLAIVLDVTLVRGLLGARDSGAARRGELVAAGTAVASPASGCPRWG